MRQKLFHHANRPTQIDFNLSSDVFEASSFVVNIDLTHDAGVVDQNVELRKLFGDLFVKSGDRVRIGNVASKGVNFWKGRFRPRRPPENRPYVATSKPANGSEPGQEYL